MKFGCCARQPWRGRGLGADDVDELDDVEELYAMERKDSAIGPCFLMAPNKISASLLGTWAILSTQCQLARHVARS